MDFLSPQFASTVGVPAIICLDTLREVRSSLDKLTDAINSLGANHAKEIADLKSAVQELRYQVAFLQSKQAEVNHNERH